MQGEGKRGTWEPAPPAGPPGRRDSLGCSSCAKDGKQGQGSRSRNLPEVRPAGPPPRQSLPTGQDPTEHGEQCPKGAP